MSHVASLSHVRHFIIKLVATTVLEHPVRGTTEYSISKDGLRLNHGKLQADKQEKTVVTLTGIKNIEKSSSPGCGRGNSTAIDSVINCLTQRFSSFRNQDIYKYMFWVDPANWSDIDTEMDAIRWCYERFQVTLDYGKIDFSRVKSEWKDFKRTVGHFYSGVTSAVKLWQKICAYRKLQFPNLIKIVEILLCLGPSNSTVEAGFSHLTGMLSDRRLSLHHSSMEDLLLIKINNLVWTEKERNAILESAVKSYISSKRRKCELDPPASTSTMEVHDHDHDHTDTCMDTECDNSDTDDEIDEHDNCSDIDSLWDRLID
ncbi:uncharacterized protein LOC126825422 [Patella vulgata]|uniref:uncharacterized protein LOC126825422 n=1 Tax=Patella vulgata TaxID=6465 RepID=UPI002180835D|nr:uncharacterized protein LOC126825422 [Patella vulgata]